jgi:uncharacterized protein (TIGR02996 family)
MMVDESPLLAAVLADPADDAPRLIYADWLDEQGRCEQAEFIRVQCELAATSRWVAGKLPSGKRVRRRLAGRRRARWDALVGREVELRPTARNWGGRLLGPLRALQVVGCGFARGFVEAVTASARSWVRHADLVLAPHPVSHVQLTTWVPLEKKTPGDAHAPGGWPPGVSVGRRWWSWETLGRPAIDPTNHHALALAVLRAEWPGVKFTTPCLPFAHGPVEVRLGGRGVATADGLYVNLGPDEPPALRLVGDFRFDPGDGWPAAVGRVAEHHTPTLEGQTPRPLPRGVRLRGLVRPVVADRTYNFVRATLVRCDPEPGTRCTGPPPATCRVTLDLIPELVGGRKVVFTYTARSG